MPKATIELMDDGGVIAMSVTLDGEFDEKSPAHNAGARVLEFLDGLLDKQPTIQDVEPRLVKTPAQLNAIKAATLVNQSGGGIVLAG